jgi:hypothetical protein
MRQILITLTLFLFTYNNALAQKKIKHFIYFELDRERIHDTSFLNNNKITGAQLKYMWRELEPKENQYNLDLIQKDLDFLTSKGKRLFIQLQDVTFDTTLRKPVPDYLTTNKRYHGGVSVQHETNENDEITGTGGYVARRWDKQVAERFNKLLQALGKRFDGKIEGLNLPETAVEFGNTGKLYPVGFTPGIYRNAILGYMVMAKKAFPNSVVILYSNFMPGEWPHHSSKSYLESLFVLAKKEGVGMGGPDIQIYKQVQMNHCYKLLKEYAGEIVSGVAVQDGNYEEINPKTGKRVTVNEIYDFANNYLGLDYIYWCTQEPYYTDDLLPFLERLSR